MQELDWTPEHGAKLFIEQKLRSMVSPQAATQAQLVSAMAKSMQAMK